MINSVFVAAINKGFLVGGLIRGFFPPVEIIEAAFRSNSEVVEHPDEHPVCIKYHVSFRQVLL